MTVPDARMARASIPAIWGDVPMRNKNFTGRDDILAQLRVGASSGGTAVLPVLLWGPERAWSLHLSWYEKVVAPYRSGRTTEFISDPYRPSNQSLTAAFNRLLRPLPMDASKGERNINLLSLSPGAVSALVSSTAGVVTAHLVAGQPASFTAKDYAQVVGSTVTGILVPGAADPGLLTNVVEQTVGDFASPFLEPGVAEAPSLSNGQNTPVVDVILEARAPVQPKVLKRW